MSRNETSLTLFNWNTVRQRFTERKKIIKIPFNTTTLEIFGHGDPIETGNTASRSLRRVFGDTGSIESPNLRRSDPNQKCFHRFSLSYCDLKCISEKKYGK